MPGPCPETSPYTISPYTIRLSGQERSFLEARARKYVLPYRDVFRAQIVLLAAQGLRNDEIAERLNSRREVVSMWRKRFFDERLLGLEERPRSGRPDVFPPELVVEVKAIDCRLPAELGLPLPRMHVPDIRNKVVRRGGGGGDLRRHHLAMADRRCAAALDNAELDLPARP